MDVRFQVLSSKFKVLDAFAFVRMRGKEVCNENR